MRALAAILLLASSPTFACPQLAGKYASCRTEPNTGASKYALEVTQKVKNRITTFTLVSTDQESGDKETETYKADGKTYTTNETDPDTGESVSLATTASCAGNLLNTVMVISYAGEALSTIKGTFSKEGNKLVQLVNEDQGNGPEEYKIICE